MLKRILYIDPKNNHNREDNCFNSLVINPSHLNKADTFEYKTFLI